VKWRGLIVSLRGRHENGYIRSCGNGGGNADIGWCRGAGICSEPGPFSFQETPLLLSCSASLISWPLICPNSHSWVSWVKSLNFRTMPANVLSAVGVRRDVPPGRAGYCA
jgi:hypothetical protein